MNTNYCLPKLNNIKKLNRLNDHTGMDSTNNNSNVLNSKSLITDNECKNNLVRALAPIEEAHKFKPSDLLAKNGKDRVPSKNNFVDIKDLPSIDQSFEKSITNKKTIKKESFNYVKEYRKRTESNTK